MGKVEGLHVVTGAFGYTGRWIAHYLFEKGAEVRTLTNSIGRDDPFDGQIEVHRYDFDDREKLVESLRGASVFYNTLGEIHSFRPGFCTYACGEE